MTDRWHRPDDPHSPDRPPLDGYPAVQFHVHTGQRPGICLVFPPELWREFITDCKRGVYDDPPPLAAPRYLPSEYQGRAPYEPG